MNFDYFYGQQADLFSFYRIPKILFSERFWNISTDAKLIRIAGDDKPIEIVHSRMMKLDSSHIEFVITCFHDNTTKVRNIKQYLLASLFNAPVTINGYYDSLVRFNGDA